MSANIRGVLLSTISRESLSKYWRYCQIYGVKNATRLALSRLRKPKGALPTHITPLAPSPVADSPVERIEKTVSVVIPTKNAGPEFRLLLKKLKAQVGLRSCELIVVDSGSSDSTVATAQAEGAIVISIPAADFNHASARNKGAAAAHGDYLLFVVQDALPLTNVWLKEMVAALETNALAAVSCAEYPRSDSDLFYQFSIHKQYGDYGTRQDRLLAWDDSCASYLGLRSNAQLSDLSALIRSDIFAQYGYRKAYAEDLDLAIRLIRDGHKLGFLYHTRVLHSHNRSSYYFLKRGYVDVRFLTEVFPNFLYPAVERKQRLFSDICSLYQRVALLEEKRTGLTFPQAAASLIEQLRAAAFDTGQHSEADGKGVDPQLLQFIDELRKHIDKEGVAPLTARNMLLPHVSRHFEEFANWFRIIYDEADETLARDVVRCFEKIFALHCGNHLAYLFLTCSSRGCLEESLMTLDRKLSAGV